MKKGIYYLVCLCILQGCSTYSKQQCETMNWEARGYEAAMKGESVSSAVSFFDQRCRAQHGVPLREQEFSDGYQRGIGLFCTPENIKNFAREGGVYAGVCPDSLVTNSFHMNYQSGREEHLLDKIRRLNREIDSLNSRISDLESQLKKQCQ